jgi:putative tricarboxylic transport membrane protein
MASRAGAAEDYPSRTIEVINQFGPGGGTDSFIRAIGEPFEEISGESLVPISVQGGGGVPAATTFFQRPADGHTLMAIGPEEVINHALGRIDLTKLQPVARVQFDQGLLYVSADSPFETIQDLVDHAKENPGALKVAVTGAGGFDDTLIGLWNLTSGTELSSVPFQSSAESLSSVLGGHTDVMYEEYGPSRGMIEAGELRPLVVFSEERLPVLPEVPTAAELGYDVTLGRWRGFSLKEGDSEEHANALYSILEEAVEAPSYKEIEEQNALQYRSKLLGPDDFEAFLQQEIEVYTDVLNQLGYIN